MEDSKATPLSEAQQARVEALNAARLVLGGRTPLGSTAIDALDLYNIAQYIITGVDPWPPLPRDQTFD